MQYLQVAIFGVHGCAWVLPWHICTEEDWMKHAFGVLFSGIPQATHPSATLFAKYTHGSTSRAET
eukprot:8750856-Pyramimonas_sp.AAC.1